MVFRKTGGGPSETQDGGPELELTLAAMDSTTVYGLPTNFGGDTIGESELLPDDEEDEDEYEFSEEVNPEDFAKPPTSRAIPSFISKSVPLPVTSRRMKSLDAGQVTISTDAGNFASTPIKRKLDSCPVQNPNVLEKLDWGDYKTGHLKTPRSQQLHTISSRRRPTLQALHSSHISKMYDELAKKKLQLADVQLEEMKIQLEERKKETERRKTEFALKKEAMELDIAIKKEQLKKLKFTNIDL
ncbi:uncharacterized protein LOC135130375 [Zophobas morio]|uniref:uncharacterized protein LOC135130375 n=1 Tax=Zophobas morio TaxID=2755281 RepID=UPI003082BB9E